MFHKVVRQHMQGVVGFLIKTYVKFTKESFTKKCLYRLRFDRIMAMSLWPHCFGPPCMSVCLLQVGFLSKQLNELSWFLARELTSTYPTLCCKEICAPQKIRYFSLWNFVPNSFAMTDQSCCQQNSLIVKLVDHTYSSRWSMHVVHNISVDRSNAAAPLLWFVLDLFCNCSYGLQQLTRFRLTAYFWMVHLQ